MSTVSRSSMPCIQLCNSDSIVLKDASHDEQNPQHPLFSVNPTFPNTSSISIRSGCVDGMTTDSDEACLAARPTALRSCRQHSLGSCYHFCCSFCAESQSCFSSLATCVLVGILLLWSCNPPFASPIQAARSSISNSGCRVIWRDHFLDPSLCRFDYRTHVGGAGLLGLVRTHLNLYGTVKLAALKVEGYDMRLQSTVDNAMPLGSLCCNPVEPAPSNRISSLIDVVWLEPASLRLAQLKS
ncbi:hypothetical protein LZ30DRAFT_705193 [Colletotrichum cereale]|nr:hypothetical protein LZ30DRAFT_705193 [Colletotrichum cereale]